MALSTLEMQALRASGGGDDTMADGAPERSMTWRQRLVALGLGLYLVFCGAFTLWFMAHVWCGSLELFKPLFPHLDFKPENLEPQHFQDILTFVNTIGGAVLGAVILCLQGLHKHAVVLRNFRGRFGGSYLLGPWASGLLGVATYAMLRGGLLVFGTDEVGENGVACYAFLSAGIMTGFAWERMLARIDDASRQLFGSNKPTVPASS
jgi:hypothetical protein